MGALPLPVLLFKERQSGGSVRKETVNAAFFFLILVLLAVLSFMVVAPILDFMLLGFLLAIGFWPVHRSVRRVVRHDGWSAFVTMSIAGIVVILPMVLVALSLLGDAKNFVSHLSLTDLEGSLLAALGVKAGTRTEQIAEFVLPHVIAFVERLTTDLAEILARMAIGLMVLVFVMFYAFAEGPRMVQVVKDLLPLKTVYKDKLVNETGNAVHAIFFGQILISVVHGVVLGIGFYLFGMPNPVLWGFVAIIVSILPAIGTPAVWLPAGIYVYATVGPTQGIGLMVYGAVISTGLVEHWIKLKLIGRMAHIHPLVVLIGVIGGIGVFGLSGFIFGPLILALLLVFTRTFSQTYGEDENYVFL